ncbi:MAG: UDP-N-acetylglucosamine 2-epimerase, partial [Bacteroidia bacterium]
MRRSGKHRIALLTSSRADYSIYFPLLKELKKEKGIQTNIIAFGSHTSSKFGNTINKISEDGFKIAYRIKSFIQGDSPKDISIAMGENIIAFSKIWKKENYDLIICLGDRYEMFAAVSSSIPFNIPIAHISGGEVTLGAIDNVFRDGLTIASKIHFASTELYKKRIIEILGTSDHVHNVGALNIDNLKQLKLYSIKEFKKKFGIDLGKESILITFHPETVSFEKNNEYIREIVAALKELKNYQLIITMPNADTMGNMIREKLKQFIAQNKNAIGVESFGTLGYLSCMKYCKMMLGNTSSGF